MKKFVVVCFALMALVLALGPAAAFMTGCYDSYDPRVPEPEHPYAERLDTDGCERFCGALDRLRCPEAHPAKGTCQGICERSSSIRSWPLDCVELAQTKLDVRACDGIRCR